MKEVASGFVIRKPTTYEATSATLTTIDMTADSLEWDPYDKGLTDNEESI